MLVSVSGLGCVTASPCGRLANSGGGDEFGWWMSRGTGFMMVPVSLLLNPPPGSPKTSGHSVVRRLQPMPNEGDLRSGNCLCPVGKAPLSAELRWWLAAANEQPRLGDKALFLLCIPVSVGVMHACVCSLGLLGRIATWQHVISYAMCGLI